MKRTLCLLLAGAMAASAVVPAFAQDSYADRRAQYEADEAAYNAQVRNYDAARDQYERDRAAYDARYGEGAYIRTYGAFQEPPPAPPPAYVDASATVPAPPPPPGAGACAQARADAKSNRVGGTILGAIIGGALGSNIAAGGHRNDGTLLGAAVGGAIGNKAGGDTAAGRYAAQCDHDGAYYTFDQTYPYAEGAQWVPRGDHPMRYYTEMRCRLAPAEGPNGEYHYVRVCPDRDGRYRWAA